MDWTEIIITVSSRNVEQAAAIAQVLVPGIYIEDYTNLEQEAREIAGIDLIDEDLLKRVAESTGGRYFRATDNTKLSEIYSEINRMEKVRTTVDSFPVYKELFGKYALWALICLLLEVLLRFIMRRMP